MTWTCEQDYWKRIRSYYDENGTLLVLKSVDNALFAATELRVLQRLLATSSSHNHTIPAEIITCNESSIIVMPSLAEVPLLPWHSLDTLIDVIQQLLQVSKPPCLEPLMLIKSRASSSCTRMG